MVTAQDAHDFYIVAATIIPVLVLTRYIGERTPLEIAGQFLLQQSEEMEANIQKLERELASEEALLSANRDAVSSWWFFDFKYASDPGAPSGVTLKLS